MPLVLQSIKHREIPMKKYSNSPRSPMRKGGRVSMRTGNQVTRMTLPDITTLRKLPIAELRKLLVSVGQGAGMSDPGRKTIEAIIKTKMAQGAKR